MMDPFAILSVDRAANKQQILRQVAVVLRERRYNAKLIAEAQKELFDPVARGAAEFKHFIDTVGCIGKFVPDTVGEQDAPNLEGPEWRDEKGTLKD